MRVELGFGLFEHGHGAPGVRHQLRRGVGQPDAAAILLEQLLADFELELGQLLRHRRGGDVECFRRGIDRALGRYGVQRAQPFEV